MAAHNYHVTNFMCLATIRPYALIRPLKLTSTKLLFLILISSIAICFHNRFLFTLLSFISIIFVVIFLSFPFLIFYSFLFSISFSHYLFLSLFSFLFSITMLLFCSLALLFALSFIVLKTPLSLI